MTTTTAASLSDKNIPVDERLMFALDVPSNDEAMRLVSELGDAVTFYKVGLELFMAGNYFALVEWLVAQNKKVFVVTKNIVGIKMISQHCPFTQATLNNELSIL